jgi:flavin-dependent dehydrogenase
MKGSGSRTAIERCVDVAVVGGGPAGCAAAIWCALVGLKVALLEAESFPRHRPGESLHPGVLTILRQLGVDREVEQADFLRYPGQTVAWGSEPQFQAFGGDADGAWMGLQAIRERFDAILLSRTEALGAMVLQPCSAQSPLMRGGRVVGIDSSGGPVQSRFVIDATGGRHWLGRRIGAGVYYASRRLIAYYGYAKAAPPTLEAFPYLEADPTGWTWVARVSEDSYAWTRLPFSRARTRLLAPPPRLGDCVPTGPTRGADVTWRLLPQSAGPGYFLAGDAAAVLDPLSSHGVLRALMSGIQAAHLVDLVLRKGVNESRAIRSYQEWCLQLFEREVWNMHELYVRLPRGWQPSIFPARVTAPTVTEQRDFSSVGISVT